MSQDESQVDFVLRWKETQSRRKAGDSVSVTSNVTQAEPETELHAVEREPGGESPDSTQKVRAPEDEFGDELFEWTEEREQRLIDAFEATPEGAVPRVQQQIGDIAKALESGELEPERAGQLLTEVELYLAEILVAEKRKVPVAHEAFVQSRSDKTNALVAWSEAVVALREYLANGDALQLKVAFYAAEQATGFLAASRDVLLAAEPEWIEKEDNEMADDDEEWDEDDEEWEEDDEEWDEDDEEWEEEDEEED